VKGLKRKKVRGTFRSQGATVFVKGEGGAAEDRKTSEN